MIGLKFGKWTVLSQVKKEKKSTSVAKHYECLCECGKVQIIRSDTLKQGRSSQCRECRNKEFHIDTTKMIGARFGKWLVIEEKPNNRLSKKLLCLCECGQKLIIDASRLKLGKTKQCHLCNVTKHGFEGSPTYNTWRCMIRRCKNPESEFYFKRGITVCDRWLNSFENFLEDMGVRPEGQQIDRINNNDGYYKENCRWVTPKQNSANRRKRPVLWNKKQ